MKLILIRHGQSEGNAAHLWQGSGDSALTERGRGQAAALGRRLGGTTFDAVYTSDLQRAIDTGRIAGFDPVITPALAEMRLGEWEGKTFAAVAEEFPSQVEALGRGEDIRLGRTGETGEEFAGRVLEAVAKAMADAHDDDTLAFFIHGGTINAIVRHVVGFEGTMFQTFGPMTNTGMCEIDIAADGTGVLSVFNDAGHLGPISDFASARMQDGAVMLDLIRHGVTQANRDRVIQGQQDWGLHPDGEVQAAALGAWIGDVDRVFSSSSGRAATTARIAFGDHKADLMDDLREMHMGEWEGLVWSEVENRPDVIASFSDPDIPRGVTGETRRSLAERARSAVDGLLATHPSGRIAAVSHGGLIGVYLHQLAGVPLGGARRFGRLDNTAVSQIILTDRGPLVGSFNLTYHLDADGEAPQTS